eukprot:s1096_g31.t1
MAQWKAANAGWYCGWCRITNRKNAQRCQTCGSHWQEAAMQPPGKAREGRSGSRTRQQAYADYGGYGEQSSSWDAGKSPRQRGYTPNPKSRRAKRAAKKKESQEEFAPMTSFQHYSQSTAVAPWPSTTTADQQSSQASRPVQQQDLSPELVTALKEAYPSEDQMPANVKAVLEKAKVETSKQLTTNLHKATSALARAQKDLGNAIQDKKKHREKWMVHLHESIRLWETQLQDYRAKQASLQDAAMKASSAVDAARAAIQKLNAQAGKSHGEASRETFMLGEQPEAIDLTVDIDEEEIRKKMQQVLQTCVDTLGPAEIQMPLQTPHIEEVESEAESKQKRPRAEEPGAASTVPRKHCLSYAPSWDWSANNRTISLFADEVESEDDFSSEEVPDAWITSLQHAASLALAQLPEVDDPSFFVLTWFIDHENSPLCNVPRLARLGNDDSEWFEEVTYTLSHLLDRNLMTFIDVVNPNPPKADYETHVRHVILTQRPTVRKSILIAVEFQNDDGPNRITALALAADPVLNKESVIAQLHILVHTPPSQIRVRIGNEEITDVAQAVHDGACIQVDIVLNKDDENAVESSETSDEESLLSIPAITHRTLYEERMDQTVQNADIEDWSTMQMACLMSQLKGTDISLAQSSMLATFAAGQPPPYEQFGNQHADHAEPSEDPDDNEDDDPNNSENNDDSVSESNENANRIQQVQLFHLDDLLIQTGVAFFSYDILLRQVAHALNAEEESVEAVHSLNCMPLHTPQEVVPLIVQLEGDMTNAAQQRLCLVDYEMHGHSSEPHFATAPTIDRQVVVIPSPAGRDTVLVASAVDHYCQIEQRRCLVFINGHLWPQQSTERKTLHNGDCIRLVIPPSICINEPTQRLLVSRQRFFAALEGITHHNLPGRSLLGPVNLVAQEDADVQSLLQHSHLALNSASASSVVHKPSGNPSRHTSIFVTHPCSHVHGRTQTWSYTEEFIQAVRLVNEAIENDNAVLPESLHHQSAFVQELYPIWISNARPNPTNEALHARIETWFLDHQNRQRSSHTRIAILSDDPAQWEQDLLRIWGDYRIPNADIHFVLVHPIPADVAPGVAGQIMLVQRADPMQTSVVVTVADSHVERGQPSSIALVLANIVSPQSLISTLDLHNSCPPEVIVNRCTVWIGEREIQPDQRMRAAHGQAFQLVVERVEPWDSSGLESVQDPTAPNVLSPIPEFANPYGAYPPDWFVQLQERFDRFATIEQPNEGPTAYVQVWYLHGENQEVCPIPRTARISALQHEWISDITLPWSGQIVPGQPVRLHVAKPEPPKKAWQTHIAHIIVMQRPPEDSAAILVTDSCNREEEFQILQLAMFSVVCINHNDFVSSLPSNFLPESSITAVDRGYLRFVNSIPVWLGHGDSIVVSWSKTEDPNEEQQQSFWPDSVTSEQSHLADDATMLQLTSQELHPGTKINLDEVETSSTIITAMNPNHSEGGGALSSDQNPQACARASAPTPLPEIPQFARDILGQSLQETRRIDDQIVHGQWIRVWYIHLHLHIRSYMARQVRLAGPPHTWRQQVIELWQDVLIPEQDREIVLVTPAPPRQDQDHEIMHDVLLYQGIDSRYMPGLVTVQTVDRTYRTYSGAVAFLNAVNRQAVIEGLALAQVCRERLCDVRQGRTAISDTQFHQMIPGRSFVIHVGRLRSVAAGSAPLSQPATAPRRPPGEHRHPSHPDNNPITRDLRSMLREAGIGYPGASQNTNAETRSEEIAYEDEVITMQAEAHHDPVCPPPRVSSSCPETPGDPLSQVAVSIPVSPCVDRVPVAASLVLPIRIAEALVDTAYDVEHPIGPGIFNKCSSTDMSQIVSLLLPRSKTVHLLLPQAWSDMQVQTAIQNSLGLLEKPPKPVPARFTREAWQSQALKWNVGSYQDTAPGMVLVLGIRYHQKQAHPQVLLLPNEIEPATLRHVLSTDHGSLLRVNGNILNCLVELKSGDVIEFHAKTEGNELPSFATTAVTISLAASLPPPPVPFQCEKPSWLILEQEDWIETFAEKVVTKFDALPLGVSLHPSTYEALHLQEKVDQHVPERIELYVDGSAKGHHAGWAIVAVSFSASGSVFQGCMSGLVEVNPASPQWIGAKDQSSTDAELTAMAIAQAIAPQVAHDCPIVIRPDLAFSHGLAARVMTSKHDYVLPKLVHLLGKFCEDVAQVHEVRGHAENPWNELADRLAKHSMLHHHEHGVAPCQVLKSIAMSPDDLKWAWIQSMKASYAFAMPELHEAAIWQPSTACCFFKETEVQAEISQDTATVDFSIVSHNALSLADEKALDHNSARRDYLIVNQWAFNAVDKSGTLQDIDTSFGHVDHVPVKLHIHGLLPAHEVNKRPKWDYEKLKDPACQAKFQEALRTLPMPTWNVGIDSHAKLVEGQLMQLAQQHFAPTGPRRRQRPVLRQSTLNLIAFKRQVLQLYRLHDFSDCSILKEELKQLDKMIRPKVQADQQAWYDEWLQQIQDSGDIHDHRSLFAKLQRLGRRKKTTGPGLRPLPILQGPDGNIARTFEACQEVFCEQFSKIEAGIRASMVQLQQLHKPQTCANEVDVSLCPSPYQLTKIIRKMKNRKAPGPGGLIVEVLKAGGEEISQHLTPLLTKAIFHQQEPLHWKSGLLIPLFKGKGKVQDPASYRSIFLSDVLAKVHHSGIRQCLTQAWHADSDVIQYGGKPGHATDLAHHILSMFLSWGRANNKSVGLLFVDLQAAFYSVHRGAFFEGELNDNLLCQALCQHGVLPEDWQQIRSQVEADAALAGVGEQAQNILRDMFSATHYTMAGVQGRVCTTRGTRPGDPIADIIFNMVFYLILRDTRDQFKQITGLPWLGCPQPPKDITCSAPLPKDGFCDISFVDDVAYCVHTDTPAALGPALQCLASCLHDVARLRGLNLNYNKGKTEVMMHHAGPGSRKARSQVWHHQHAKLPVVTEHVTSSLHVVHEYKHLGSYVQDFAVNTKDARLRVAQAKQAVAQLQRSFFGKRNISLHTKATVFRALVSSRHIFQAHTWSWVTAKEVAQWNSGLRGPISMLVKDIIRPVPAFHFSTEHLYALAELNAPEDLLHANRLRYLSRMIATAPAFLWQLLHRTDEVQAWPALALQSYAWLRKYSTKVLPVTDSFIELCSFISMYSRLPGVIKSALKSCQKFHAAEARGLLWALQIERFVHSWSDDDPKIDAACTKQWQCAQCGKSFDSKRALAMHARQSHQYRKWQKYYALDVDCLACGKRCFARSRFIAHLTTSHECAQVYKACLPPAPEAVVEQIEAEEREIARTLKMQGWHTTKAFLPVLKIPFAELPPADSEGAALMLSRWSERNGEQGNAFNNLEGYATLDQNDTANDDNIVPFLGQTFGGRIAGHGGVFQMAGLSSLHAQVYIKSLVFVHFYSGFRRTGDLQWQIENFQVVENVHLFCLSIDLCLAKEHSDLTNADTKAFWLKQIRVGNLLGLGGGPRARPGPLHVCWKGAPPRQTSSLPVGSSSALAQTSPPSRHWQ